MKQSLIYHGGGISGGKFSSSGGSVIVGAAPVLLQTNFQYNDSEVTTLEDRFIAWKVICKHNFIADAMGCFIWGTNGLRKVNLGIYTEVGVLMGETGEIVLPEFFHEEWQHDLESVQHLTKGGQYWLGMWGDSIDIGTEIGFSNLGVLFPDRVHCIDESWEPSLPTNISQLTPGTQQAAIWARGFYAAPV